MTITLGWWLAPLAVTLIGFAYLLLPEPRGYGYGDIGGGIVAAFQCLIVLVLVLAAWLIWAVVA